MKIVIKLFILLFFLTAIMSNPVTGITAIILALLAIAFKIYELFYYKSEDFFEIKNRFLSYVNDCNQLNDHIEELKQTYTDIKKINYGSANLVDSSRYNFKRSHQVNAVKSEFIHECSGTVVKNAEAQPFKYLCKYFNIKTDEASLNDFERVLNNFSAAEEGKKLLKEELEDIRGSLKSDVPFIISRLGMKKFMKKLGFTEVDFKTVYFPTYSFRYISPGGNKSTRCDVELNIKNLNNFIEYFSEMVKFRNSVAGQRALMTTRLREFIKNRDNYTCKNCGISTSVEPHLLLEIDHIMPISKGGLTSEDNLQTLCWKCNRTKGAKIIS